jgi:hypothetical protein
VTEKTFAEELADRDYARLKRVGRRADALYATALAECAEYLNDAWSHVVRYHLRNLTRRIAELEEQGLDLGRALAQINGNERRPACGHCIATRTWGEGEGRVCPPRPPAAWMDAHDAHIFKARFESQKKFANIGGGRGDKEPRWTPKRITNAIVEAGISEEQRLRAEQASKRRAEMNARIPLKREA